MAKILLVEDDKSLREIYGVRLMAEGYEIVSAGDGEEALAMAIKEKPDLIVSDVMMPKISGFDMLDILRSTTETKGVKVIMMTALSSDDQRARGEALGADRYLVKSQVGIEDVVRTVHEVIGDGGALGTAAPAPNPFAATEPTVAVPVPEPAFTTAPSDATTPDATMPVQIPPMPDPIAVPAPIDSTPTAVTDTPAPDVSAPSTPAMPDPIDFAAPAPMEPTPTDTPAAIETPMEPAAPTPDPVPEATPVAEVPPAPTPAPLPPVINATTVIPRAPTPPPAPAPQAPVQPSTLPEPTAPFSTPRPGSVGDRVINPLSPAETGTPDMSALMSQELSGGATPAAAPPVPPTPPIPPMPGQPTA